MPLKNYEEHKRRMRFYYKANREKIDQQRSTYRKKMTNLGYHSYVNAKRRCEDCKNHNYGRYGARGIQFKFQSFNQLLTEIGPRPPGFSLDRINTNGHYEPGNVRWASSTQQQHNRRDNVLSENQVRKIKKLFKNGIRQAELMKMFNISRGCIHEIVRGRRWRTCS